MTIVLRKPALVANLCKWYRPDQRDYNRQQLSRQCKEFLGNGRKIPHDTRAAMDKVQVMTL